MLPVLAAVVGLVVGSFINVLIWRLPRGESVMYPPSHCPSCQHRLGARDLVPVLSWLLLRGRCRYCGSPVPVSYPLVEAVTAAIFAALVAVHGLHLRTAAYAVLATILITAAGTDMRWRLIPNRLTLPAIAFALAWSAAVRVPHLTSSLLGLGIAGGLFLVIAILSRGGMGGGDVKLAAAAGAFLGLQYSLLGLFLAFILGAVVGLVLMALGKKRRRDYIPFAPFIASGCLAAMLFGDPILQWYLGIR